MIAATTDPDSERGGRSDQTDPNPGMRCPRCNCAHLPALYTRRRGRVMVRVRRCRYCGHRVSTREIIQSNGT